MLTVLAGIAMGSTPAPSPSPLPVEVVNSGGYDWGNLVVQVVIAALTLGTLAWAVKTGRDEARRASRDRQEALAAEERQQASRVSAWERQWVTSLTGERLSPEAAVYAMEDDAMIERRELYLLNASDAPIYDVVVRYNDTPSVRAAAFGEESDLNHAWFHAIMPPSPTPRDHPVARVPNCGALAEDVVLEVEFSDSSGRYWLRDQHGTLHRRTDLDALTPEQRQRRWMIESEGSSGEEVDWDPVPGDPDYVGEQL